MAEVATGKSEVTRQKLIEAGIKLFAENGYEATSTRTVQTAAGVQRNLITYHFGSKEAFWKACMVALFGRLGRAMGPAVTQSADIEPKERIRFLVRRYIRASAAHPETTRIMFDEGRCDDWRLTFLVDNFVRGFFEAVTDLYAAGSRMGAVPPISVMQFYYVLVSGACMFAMRSAP